MKIAIAASENNLKSTIYPHFGRCRWFCLFDTVTRKSEFFENTVNLEQEKSGCDAAEFLMKMGVELVIAGRFGSRVSEKFRNSKIQMVIPDKASQIRHIIHQIK